MMANRRWTIDGGAVDGRDVEGSDSTYAYVSCFMKEITKEATFVRKRCKEKCM